MIKFLGNEKVALSIIFGWSAIWSKQAWHLAKGLKISQEKSGHLKSFEDITSKAQVVQVTEYWSQTLIEICSGEVSWEEAYILLPDLTSLFVETGSAQGGGTNGSSCPG